MLEHATELVGRRLSGTQIWKLGTDQNRCCGIYHCRQINAKIVWALSPKEHTGTTQKQLSQLDRNSYHFHCRLFWFLLQIPGCYNNNNKNLISFTRNLTFPLVISSMDKFSRLAGMRQPPGFTTRKTMCWLDYYFPGSTMWTEPSLAHRYRIIIQLAMAMASGVCGQSPELKTPGSMLASPEVQMLQLDFPDIEKLMIQKLMRRDTSAPTGFVDGLSALFRTEVTEIQTIYGRLDPPESDDFAAHFSVQKSEGFTRLGS